MVLQLSRLWLAGMIPALAVSAEVNRSWDVLMQSLEPGKTVVVTRMSSAKVEGKLLSIASDSITVKWRGQPQVVVRDDVFRVRIANIRRRNTLITMAVAGGIAALVGAASVDYDKDAAAVLGGGMVAGIGAAVGGALPIGKPLYEAVKPKSPGRK